jgi:ABC-type transporter Mla maintaining outer membrane lipid asymmetry ATPase subunit MlaF
VRDEQVEGILSISADYRWTVFVSSHELVEIENLVTHVAYIDRGRLQFGEELTSLEDRLPTPWPEAWLKPEAYGAVVSCWRRSSVSACLSGLSARRS